MTQCTNNKYDCTSKISADFNASATGEMVGFLLVYANCFSDELMMSLIDPWFQAAEFKCVNCKENRITFAHG